MILAQGPSVAREKKSIFLAYVTPGVLNGSLQISANLGQPFGQLLLTYIQICIYERRALL